jgi:hypothetical protein
MSTKQWPTWLFSYNLDGKQWSMEIVAPTADEAKRRLDAAATWGKLDGELIAKVPVAWGGFLIPLVIWVRNAFRALSKQGEGS